MYKTQYTFSPKYIHSPPLTPPLTDYDYVDKKNTPPSKFKTYNSKSYFKKFFIGLILTLLSIIAYKISLVLISRPTLEIVYSYYDEDLDEFSRFSNLVRQKLHWKFRITDTVYVKNEAHSPILHKQLNKIVDNVAYLPNIGREGATYLHHITQRYKATIFPDDLNNQTDEILADKTLFLQPHPAWHWIMYDRLDHINVDTGYISLGPYVPGSCGVSEGHTLPQMKTIWQLFTNTECPEDETQLVTWAGQFMVSQDRILNNPYSKYADILSMLEAPADDPIHSETPWWFMSKNDPSNPFIGHSLERSWPIIFDCNRPDFSDPEKCGGKAEAGSPECQCFD
ncbi:hypothetical protein E3Q02_00900 [Wallemia mellicola]|uniref:Uncharacterized protein n=1 Tax=Wallemia mellicola TaxID=1708541 RepID=A0AB38MXW1_9BASI|nr:hypothetical protein E3Q02_00900 [Wallemia mellicola]